MRRFQIVQSWLMLAAVLAVAEFAAAGGNCPHCNTPGCYCTPNCQTFGYVPTEWRRWPGTNLEEPKPNVRGQGFPTPRYELPRPLHEADAGHVETPMAPADLPMGSPMGAPMNPSMIPPNGLPPTRTIPEPKTGPMTVPGNANPQPMPEINPFSPMNNKATPGPNDNGSYNFYRNPEGMPGAVNNRVRPASASFAENPANHNVQASSNPLRYGEGMGWRAAPPSKLESLDSEIPAPFPRPSANPLRGN
jgi:hypothetical protein